MVITDGDYPVSQRKADKSVERLKEGRNNTVPYESPRRTSTVIHAEVKE
jgi:hypothetical protein